jgi:hypothetical protein
MREKKDEHMDNKKRTLLLCIPDGSSGGFTLSEQNPE